MIYCIVVFQPTQQSSLLVLSRSIFFVLQAWINLQGYRLLVVVVSGWTINCSKQQPLREPVTFVYDAYYSCCWLLAEANCVNHVIWTNQQNESRPGMTIYCASCIVNVRDHEILTVMRGIAIGVFSLHFTTAGEVIRTYKEERKISRSRPLGRRDCLPRAQKAAMPRLIHHSPFTTSKERT